MLPLRMMGADAKLILPNKKLAFSTMEEVISAARWNRDGVVMFGINWVRNGTRVGHALIARWGPMGFRIVDRSGAVVKTLAELEPNYQGISQAVPVAEALVVGNSITARAFSTVPSLMNLLALEVKPAIVRPAVLTPPSVTTAPAKVPSSLVTKKNMGRVTVHTTCIAPNSESPEVCSSYYTYQVAPGDSLAKIARYAYKNEGRWQIIYQANKVLLGPNPHDPKSLKAGMELFIPSR